MIRQNVRELITQILFEEQSKEWPLLSEIPCTHVQQAIAAFDLLDYGDRLNIAAAIGDRAACFWFLPNSSFADSSYYIDYINFIQNCPYPEWLRAPIEKISCKLIVEDISAITQNILGTPKVKRISSVFTVRATGNFQGERCEALFELNGKDGEFEWGFAPLEIAKICAARYIRLPSYEDLLGFGPPWWDRISVNVRSKLPNLIEACFHAVTKIFQEAR